jgi:hypothetical protein
MVAMSLGRFVIFPPFVSSTQDHSNDIRVLIPRHRGEYSQEQACFFKGIGEARVTSGSPYLDLDNYFHDPQRVLN